MERKLTISNAPEFLTSGDLVSLGLYKCEDSVYAARRKGLSPDFIKFGKRILYPKDKVIEFKEKNMRSGGSIDSPQQDSEASAI
jgi:hypothetical protein